ncbi:type II secretion system F family protein [Nocardioides currus]|uniref:VWFA domain-containing protein n=1 Tax=Nocardioides currus TaxID=2133958 RepID=A0A2R7YW27_9ACTN|nr:type II secretion system F family protein [Nocardioides currus]PUA80610.1 hypothetical protein C7S10_12685 [Nocardioides currus]
MTLRHWSRSGVLLASAIATTLLTATPALAADEVSIDHVESTDGVVSMIVSVDGVPGGGIGSDDFEVQVDGKGVDADVSSVSAGNVSRSTMLVVDASNSMRGAKFDAASDAVTAFLANAPSDVQVGMVAFAGKVGTVIKPNGDRAALLDEFKNLDLTAGTSVYDALDKAIDVVGTEGSRSLLVLSDGADTGSSATVADIARKATDAEVVVDAVSIGSVVDSLPFVELSEKTSGQTFPADADALSQLFADQAEALAQQMLVKFSLPPGVSGDADVAVTVQGAGDTFDDSAFVNVGDRSSTAVSVEPESTIVAKPLIGTPVMLAGAVALFLGIAVLLWAMIAGSTGRKASVEKRLNSYFASGDGRSGDDVGKRRAAESAVFMDSAVAITDRLVKKDFEDRVNKRLVGAGSALTASEWVLLHAAIALGTAAVFFFLLGGAMSVLGLLLGIALPWLYLGRRHSKRLRAFNGQLAETLGLMAGGLQAGLSLPQAVDTVVREGIEPMSGELRRALVEQRLGIDISDALEGVGERMESEDFSWVVMAIRIQREVGGNLAEILHTVADTLREREYLRRQVRALSAEGRMSGYILAALPVFVMIWLSFANRDYIEVLWTTPIGFVILGVASMFLALGGWVMAKMAQVEV